MKKLEEIKNKIWTPSKIQYGSLLYTGISELWMSISEHEACIVDLNELQWHVSYAGRTEKRIENKTSVAEKFNRQLKDDIAFVKKHM